MLDNQVYFIKYSCPKHCQNACQTRHSQGRGHLFLPLSLGNSHHQRVTVLLLRLCLCVTFHCCHPAYSMFHTHASMFIPCGFKKCHLKKMTNCFFLFHVTCSLAPKPVFLPLCWWGPLCPLSRSCRMLTAVSKF